MTSDWPPPRQLNRWALFLRRRMNRVAIIEQAGNPRFDIVVDGRRLAEHFAGRQGSHPVQVIPIGWKDADCRYEQETLEQLLGLRSSGLLSGRVPVLVCEQCGDVACGALAVRINRCDAMITWTDWAYENGYEPTTELTWLTHPALFEFNLNEYEKAFSDTVPSG